MNSSATFIDFDMTASPIPWEMKSNDMITVGKTQRQMQQ